MTTRPRPLTTLALAALALLAACATAPASGGAARPAAAAPAPRADDPPDGVPDFAMAVYPLVLLKAGPKRGEPLDEMDAQELQVAHMQHIEHMADLGHLLLAGPMLDRPGDDPIIGLLLFRSGHDQAARELPAQDPLVRLGRLRAELVNWYGPAGLTFPGDPGADAARADEPAPDDEG